MKKIKLIIVLCLSLIGISSFLTFSDIQAEDSGEMAAAIGGGFVVEPNGKSTLYGHVYTHIENGTPVGIQLKERPIANAKVEVYEGLLYLNEYNQKAPITVGFTNNEGAFFIEVEGKEGERAGFSFKITKDGETTVYSGANSGSYVDEWPTIQLDVKNLTIDKNDIFENENILVNKSTYTLYGYTIDYNWNNVAKIETVFNGDVDSSIPGVYEVDAITTVKMLTKIPGKYAKGIYIDSRIETKKAYITVLETESSVVTYYQDENGNNLLPSKTTVGYIGDDYITEKKDIKDYNLSKIIGNVTGIYTKETIDVIYVYEKDVITEKPVTEKPARTETKVSSSPITGDDTNIELLISLFLVSSYIVIYKFRREVR